MKFRYLFFLLFCFLFIGNFFSQETKKFERHYGRSSYWTKTQAKKELQSCLFWNDIERGDVIADIGALSGHIDIALSLFFDSLTFYLQEIQPDRLNKNGIYEVMEHFTKENGKPIGNQFKFIIGDNYRSGLPDNTFDKIFMNSVFEYVSRYDQYLTDLKSKIKKDGRIYVKTDNPFPKEFYIKIFEAYGFTCEKAVNKGGWKQFVFIPVEKNNEIKDIFDAVIKKDYDRTKAFLDKGVNANSSLGTADLLQIAGSISNNQKILKLLIERGANLKTESFFVYSALGKLGAAGEYETVKLLIENGAKATGENLMMAVWFGHDTRIVKLMVESGAHIYQPKPSNDVNILLHAGQGSDLEIIKYLLDQPECKDLYKKDRFGENFMHYAAYGYNVNVMKYLLDEKKFNINELDNEAFTVLMYAVYGGSMDMIKYLIEEKKMDVNQKNANGFTALHYAHDPEIKNYLMAKGAQ